MGLLDKIFKTKTPVRNKDTGTPLERYEKSLFHAIDGIIYTLKYEHNMIIILISTILVVIISLLFHIKKEEWLFIIFICGSIASCEMINSSIEATVDLVTTEIHPLAKIAKDTASSATLILCIVSFIGGLIIFLPRIITLLGG